MEVAREKKVEKIRKAKRASVIAAEQWAHDLEREQSEEHVVVETGQSSKMNHAQSDERTHSFNGSQASHASLNFSKRIAKANQSRPISARTPDGYLAVSQLLQESLSHSEELPLRESGRLHIRVGKVGLTGQTSLIRTKPHDVELGNGLLVLKREGAEAMEVPVNSIKGVSYAKMSSRTFSVRTEEGKALWVKAGSEEDAQRWVKGILEEVRLQAIILNTCVKALLEQKSENEHSIESLLRETVDLFSLAKSFKHPDSTDAMERLAKWLEEHNNQDEAAYWYDWAGKGRIAFNNESRQEDFGIDMNLTESGEKSALSTLQRKPVAKRSNNATQINKTVDTMLKVLQEVGQSSGDNKKEAVESML